MRFSVSGWQGCGRLLVMLALPFAGHAGEVGSPLYGVVTVPAEDHEFVTGANSTSGSIQLAAAIGIVKPDAEPGTPAAPVVDEVPPVASKQEEPAQNDAEEAESKGSTTKTILIGAGVAALLGALAGGGSSSTSGH